MALKTKFAEALRVLEPGGEEELPVREPVETNRAIEEGWQPLRSQLDRGLFSLALSFTETLLQKEGKWQTVLAVLFLTLPFARANFLL